MGRSYSHTKVITEWYRRVVRLGDAFQLGCLETSIRIRMGENCMGQRNLEKVGGDFHPRKGLNRLKEEGMELTPA